MQQRRIATQIYLLAAKLFLILAQDQVKISSSRRYEVLLPIQPGIQQRQENISPYSTNSAPITIHGDEIKLVKVKFPPMQFQSSDTGEELQDGNESAWSLYMFALATIFFGGISAHRTFVRRKYFGNRCCNNRRLENDLTYDIAFTTIPIDSNYGSFGSSWTGDLEKFDV